MTKKIILDCDPGYDDAVAMSSLIPKVTFTHVRRSDPMVARADAMLNRTMDAATGVR